MFFVGFSIFSGQANGAISFFWFCLMFYHITFHIFIANGQGPWSQVEKNYLNGKLKAITAYFNATAVDNKSA